MAERIHRTRAWTSAVLGAALLVAPVAVEVTAEAAPSSSAPTTAAPTGAAPTAAAAVTAAAQANGRAVKAFEKRPFYTRELGLAHPMGATYLDGLRLLDPRSEKVVGRVRLAVRLTPGTLADNGRGRLAALSGRTFVTWSSTARGTVRPAHRKITGASVAQVRGMTYDPETRAWLGLDASRSRLVSLRAKGGSMRAVATGRVAGL